MKTRTLYDVLQIAPNAAPPIVDAAYEHLRAHFDLSEDTAGGRLVDDAYTTLRNPEARRAYDAKLAQWAREHDVPATPVRPARASKCRVALAGWAIAAAVIGFSTAVVWYDLQPAPVVSAGAHATQATAMPQR